MQDGSSPKIILNEEFIDLRKYPHYSLSSKQSTRTHTTRQRDTASTAPTSNLKNEGLRFEKELINSGLKKLVCSYNATANANMHPRQQIVKKKVRMKEKSMFDPRFHRIVDLEQKSQLKSQSELTVLPKKRPVDQSCTSTPVFQSKKTSSIEIEGSGDRYDHHKNKCTMTKNENSEGHILKPRQERRRSKSKDPKPKEIKLFSRTRNESVINQYVDPRLCEKYSILKMPWKGTWTIPVFSPRTSNFDNRDCDNFDRQTYLYDEGTEIDSVVEEEKFTLQKRYVTITFFVGGACGILLASLLIWYIFGYDFFDMFLKPHPERRGSPLFAKKGPDFRGVKHYIAVVGGGVIHLITSFLSAIGDLLAMPTQRVFHSPEQYKWPSTHQ